MSEIEQLRQRIDNSGMEGIETAVVREDYEPAGDMMMRELMDSDEYVQRKTPMYHFDPKWRIFKKGNEPY